MLQQCYMELLKQKEGGNRMNHYEAINDVLVNLFNEILDLEERALIDTHVKKLRSKMGDKGEYIKTVWGMGYKFEVDE